MEEHPLLAFEGLSISFGGQRVVERLDLAIRAGERVALVGESGSGKTVTALSALRLVPRAQIEGSIRLAGVDLLTRSEAQMRQVRGGDIAMIFQEPMAALNPLFTIGSQIIETLRLHEGLDARDARAKTIDLLARTGIREPERRVDSYAHQLSGGQRQRAMIAMALACRPQLLIADEPTTALDVTIRARIVHLLLDLQREEAERSGGRGMAILLITHDLHLVRHFAQRVAVMERGRLVEAGPTDEVFADPRHPYTRRLLNAVPRRTIAAIAPNAPLLLAADRLRVDYPQRVSGWRGWLRAGRFPALKDASLSLHAGETIGVVGESGSGKSTLAQALLRLTPLRSGSIAFDGTAHAARDRRSRRAMRARLQVVFQDPFGSLSPRQTVGQIVGEGLGIHFPQWDAARRQARIVEVLHEVGLPERILASYPHEFSGGQRQRIAIARALALSPQVLILDEPTSSLDVSIQSQVLELLIDLQKRLHLSYVLISHDLAVVQALAHRLYIMKDGEIVESGATDAVIARPSHPYTRKLIHAALEYTTS